MNLQLEKPEILARAIGRRKEAVAQVKLVKGTGDFIINNKSAQNYLHNNSCSLLSIKSPFEALQNLENNLVSGTAVPEATQITTIVKVEGGGLVGQAEAIKLAVARAVCQLTDSTDLSVRKTLKDRGYLTQDARVKERRKYGLRKARKASQYHKR